MRWDEWRGSMDGRPSMYIKRLIYLKGWRVDLHKIVRSDDIGCFHTHSAYVMRIILWGGYVEEVCRTWPGEGSMSYREWWKPCHIGIVKPNLEHRIAHIINGRSSYSLWIRGPKIAEVKVRGC